MILGQYSCLCPLCVVVCFPKPTKLLPLPPTLPLPGPGRYYCKRHLSFRRLGSDLDDHLNNNKQNKQKQARSAATTELRELTHQESLSFSVFYNNALFLALVILFAFYLFKNVSGVLYPTLQTYSNIVLLYLSLTFQVTSFLAMDSLPRLLCYPQLKQINKLLVKLKHCLYQLDFATSKR